MFEHFDERARSCIVLAQEEARRLGHDELGTVHLLLGVAGVDDGLLGVELERVRAAVVALLGNGPAQPEGVMPFTAEAKAALEGANDEALKRGHTIIDAAHLLLAVLDAGGGATRALREAGAIPGDVRERANVVAGSAPQPPPGATFAAPAPGAPVAPPGSVARRERSDHAEDLRRGDPVPVTLGMDARGIGDLGSPNVDRRLLELLLVNDTRAARLLREHGIDEQRLRDAFGSPERPG